MPNFAPTRICLPYDFDVKRNRQGLWIVRDRCGLAGGTFLTRKDAVHFALFEAGGDTTHVHAHPAAKAAEMANGLTAGTYHDGLGPECHIAAPKGR
jgi:hypothetical protein